jgi:hypothetical protein
MDWFADYCNGSHCTLCGNYGVIDTRDVRTPGGVLVGRLNYCLCPNGQALKEAKADLKEWACPTAQK